MKIIAKLILSLTLLYLSILQVKAQSNDCLFKNPLCFYNSDILTYLQVLHKNQQYEQMLPYMSGPVIDGLSKTQKVSKLENASFGYQMKRSGVKEISKSEWNLTYSRTIMGTQENFKIRCVTQNNLCTVYLDEQAWRMIFR
jgi:hypothetical protein